LVKPGPTRIIFPKNLNFRFQFAGIYPAAGAGLFILLIVVNIVGKTRPYENNIRQISQLPIPICLAAPAPATLHNLTLTTLIKPPLHLKNSPRRPIAFVQFITQIIPPINQINTHQSQPNSPRL